MGRPSMEARSGSALVANAVRLSRRGFAFVIEEGENLRARE
jgi:hypothetical protein